MVSGGIKPKQLTVRHVRQPCQWMPVCFCCCCEGPDNCSTAQTRLYLRVTDYIGDIIQVDELVSSCLPEHRKNCCQKRKADQQRSQFIGFSANTVHMTFIYAGDGMKPDLTHSGGRSLYNTNSNRQRNKGTQLIDYQLTTPPQGLGYLKLTAVDRCIDRNSISVCYRIRTSIRVKYSIDVGNTSTNIDSGAPISRPTYCIS